MGTNIIKNRICGLHWISIYTAELPRDLVPVQVNQPIFCIILIVSRIRALPDTKRNNTIALIKRCKSFTFSLLQNVFRCLVLNRFVLLRAVSDKILSVEIDGMRLNVYRLSGVQRYLR